MYNETVALESSEAVDEGRHYCRRMRVSIETFCKDLAHKLKEKLASLGKKSSPENLQNAIHNHYFQDLSQNVLKK